MKKTIRILIPIVLAIAIVFCMAWYLFIYDRSFTRDALLSFARYSESQGNHSLAAWFYSQAYSQAADNDDVAIELAEQYKSSGNYTKAEFTLSNAIKDGGGINLYIALCKTYIEQDKLLDAVNMLDNIVNPDIKRQIAAIRPEAPVAVPDPGFYSKYISVSLKAEGGTIYASAQGQYPSLNKDIYTQPVELKDGENTIYAVTHSENGLVSSLSVFGYTVGGVIEKMTFADPTIEAEVRKLLNVTADKELFTNDLWTIKSFTVPAGAKTYADLKHMAFLEKLVIDNGVPAELEHLSHLSNIKELSITGTAVSQENLEVIGRLSQLEALTLQGCSITSVAPLQGATAIVTLNLSNNAIRNIDALKTMTKLTDVQLQRNALADVSALAGATALKTLNISYNSITSLAPLSGLTGITWLDASTNSITDLGKIGNLKELTTLSLKSNKLISISALNGCTKLTDLNVSSNALTDISGVEKLTKLMYLDFSYNKVTKLPAFSKKCDLVNIFGNHNSISSLEPLAGLQNLNKVHMDYNAKISSVKPLADCHVLVEVNVYGTKVKNVTSLTNQGIIVNYNPVKK